jgi:hypothetical protein
MSFTNREITNIRAILANPLYRGDSKKTNADNATHCLEQIVRISRMLNTETPPVDARRRDGQICLNYGRLQEILEGNGGMERWWNVFHPLWEEKNYAELESVAKSYADVFGLKLNPENFM